MPILIKPKIFKTMVVSSLYKTRGSSRDGIPGVLRNIVVYK